MKISFPKPKNLDEFKLFEKAKGNEGFKKIIAYKKDITKYITDDIYSKTHSKNPNHRIITIIGETGSGKSLTGLTIAYNHISKEITTKNIVFLSEHALQRCKLLKRNTIIILDEQTLGVGVGSVREAMELRNLEEVTRKNQLNFIFISPTPRLHLTSHLNLEVFYKDEKKKINWLAVIQDDKYLGYIKVKVNPDWELWKEYEKEKDKFIDMFLERKTTRLDYEKMAKKVIHNKKFQMILQRDGKVKGEDLFYIVGREYPTITSTERKELISELKISFADMFKKKIK